MIPYLARMHLAKESDVVAAWAEAWAALNLAPVFAALDAHALAVPRALSHATDQRTRALQKAVIEGVLSVADLHADGADGIAELTQLFQQPDATERLVPQPPLEPDQVVGIPAEFVRACNAVNAIASMADFLFAALTVPRPEAMDLPELLQLGTTLRQQTGIDSLEHVLMDGSINPAQEALRGHALHSLRRTQQRLLGRVALQVPAGGSASEIIASITSRLKNDSSMADVPEATEPHTLEQAVLNVWALSEATSSALSDAA